jgi:hypothetical protein
MRHNRIISIFKPKAKASILKTIKWYEKAIYKSNLWEQHQVGSLRDFKPEFHYEDDVYADQYPEFTRTDELEEIYQFIASIKGRRRSVEEQQILRDIYDELGAML